MLLLAFVASGLAALGYEILWTRLFALALGSETMAILGVLAGFFGGLALGGRWAHSRARRSRHPLRLFAGLELFAALYAVASPWWLFYLADALPRWLGPVVGNNAGAGALLVTMLVAGVLLLPATMCLGATLAVLVEARRRAVAGTAAGTVAGQAAAEGTGRGAGAAPQWVPGAEGRSLGRLYAANTLGATAGVFLTLYVVLPALGFAGGAILLACFGLLAAGLALWWGKGNSTERGVDADAAPHEAREDPVRAAQSTASKGNMEQPFQNLTGIVFATGLLGVGLEVVLVHVLGRALENTVFTFANLLGVYLLGTAVGAWVLQRWQQRRGAHNATRTRNLLLGLLGSSVLSAMLAGAAIPILEAFAPDTAPYGQKIMAELLLAVLVFGPPTLCMGAVFADLVGRYEQRGVGAVYAWNTLGGTLAPLVFGLGLIEPLGSAWALRVVVLGYAVVAVIWSARQMPKAGALRVLPPAAVGLFGLLLVPSNPNAPELPPGTRILDVRESLAGTVHLLQPGQVNALGTNVPELLVGRHFVMGGGLSYAEQRMGHIPLLFSPEAKRVLFLGVGTGATAGASLGYRDIEQVDAVELHPDIVDLLPRFAQINGGLDRAEKATVHQADARRFAAAVQEPYDLVVGDLFHPGRDGAGNLYSLEHFERLRDRVAPGGLVAQWVPLHEFDAPTLQLLARTFLAAFDDASAWLGYYNTRTPLLLLLGTDSAAYAAKHGAPFAVDLVGLSRATMRGMPASQAIDGDRDVLTGFVADRAGLAAFAGEGALHTDRHPRLHFSATRAAYANRPEDQYGSLFALWEHRTPLPAELIAFPDSARLVSILAQADKGREALDLYLQADRIWNQSGYGPIPPSAMELYQKANKTDPQFAPARGVLARQRR